MRISIAIVKETGLGDSGRAIKVQSETSNSERLVHPAYDGLIKLPAPEVGEFVYVLTMDEGNLYRQYLPIRSAFTSLTDDPSAIQIESAGEVHIDGTAVLVGVDAVEPMILGDTLVSLLEQLCDALAAETHTGNIGLPTSPPLNAAQYTAIKAQLATAKALIGKVK